MKFINIQALIILTSALFGLMLSVFVPLEFFSMQLTEIFIIFLLYFLFLTLDIKQMKKAVLNLKYTLTSVGINFIITPIIAYYLGLIFFENVVEIRIGLMMLLVTPCTDWYLIFTKRAEGNSELNVAILPINLILQICLLPIYLQIFFKSSVNIPIDTIINSIFFVLFIPFVAAIVTRFFFNKNIVNKLIDKSDTFQLIFLCLAVVFMFAHEGHHVLMHLSLFIKLFIPLICFFIILFYIGKMIAHVLKFSRAERISLHFTTLARNSPLALALAISTFPNAPLIAISLIIAPLLELPILSIIAEKFRKK